MGFRLTSAAFIGVFAVYLFLGGMGVTDHGRPRDAPYNLLARGLLSGHLYVDRAAPPILAQLRDPYDPEANRDARDARDGLNDFSYFHGRLYLYFGVAPALLVFIPWHLLTGGWLPHWVAVVFLCSAGLAVNLSLIHSVRLRIFPRAGPWALAACVPLLGLASCAPLLLARAELWEVPIAFSYLLVAVALRCLWEAGDGAGRKMKWIALASLAAGAAFAARPTMLPNAAILLVPFLSRATRRDPRAWAAAALPFAFCGAGVALYNFERFGNPFEFGLRLTLERYYNGPSLSFVPTNLGLYLLQPVSWSALFPFVHAPAIGLQSHLPPNHAGAEQIMGALLNVPVLWAALAMPTWLLGGNRDHRLLPLALSAGWVALSSLALFSSFFFACSRYQFEFVPGLALLAALGVLALEAGWGDRVRRLARCAWIPALLFSCAFTVLYGIDRSVTDHNTSGLTCLAYRDFSAAEHEFGVARLLAPRNPGSRVGEGAILLFRGRLKEAQAELEGVTRDSPDNALGHYFLGAVFSGEERRADAVTEFEAAHRLDPGNLGINKGLASALAPVR
jgi:hypothetical protein